MQILQMFFPKEGEANQSDTNVCGHRNSATFYRPYRSKQIKFFLLYVLLSQDTFYTVKLVYNGYPIDFLTY
jgi:hypothetical protein